MNAKLQAGGSVSIGVGSSVNKYNTKVYDMQIKWWEIGLAAAL